MELNVLGTQLQPCCADPATGYFRDGYCRTMSQDTGTHIVCAIMTTEFLDQCKRVNIPEKARLFAVPFGCIPTN